MVEESLGRYRQMRDFERTPEPAGGESVLGDANSFVIQKHLATALHYDVRIEVDGVMPSWAVPKGPSYNPQTKRLAMHVEDHPLDYQTFEGIIPKGEYGGGPVIVWDRGTYRNLTEKNGRAVDARAAIEAGHISIWFDGDKLHGGWSLTRTRKNANDKDSWIMVKRKDEFATDEIEITSTRPESVASGRTLEEVRDGVDADEWTPARAMWVAPMLAEPSTIEKLSAGEDWIFERKLDGLRCVAVRNGDDVELWSRNHLSFNARFPKIIEALQSPPVDNFVIDGEIVAFDHQGRTSFGLLQQRSADADPVFAVFDVLHLLGRDTRDLSVRDRKQLLSQIFTSSYPAQLASSARIKLASSARIKLASSGRIQLVEELEGNAGELLHRACREEWEGLIAKRAGAPYRAGRSPQWRKLKCSASQEMVIGGWTEPKGARRGFGALLLGYFDNRAFRYAGKVGTGFDAALLLSLHDQLLHLEQPKSPFVEVVKEKGAHWAKPELVANIAFTEWTSDAKLRHSRFEGLRDDKDAKLVVRETSPNRN